MIFILLYRLGFFLGRWFSPKIKKGWEGRKLPISLNKKSPNQQVIWMHCASLGEWEQGRPILENLKKEYPHYFFLLTFFSPSGYDVAKNNEITDFVTYLPLDSPSKMKKFIESIQPEMLLLVKYEFWYNLLNILHQKKIPVFLISGIFRSNQLFFKPYGHWFVKKIKTIEHFFVQDKKSAELLHQIDIKHVTISGDSRFDRVRQLIDEDFSNQKMESFIQNKKVFILGSTWPEDDDLLINYLKEFTLPDEYKIIIAPHEIHPTKMEKLKNNLPLPTILYTDETPDYQAKIMILNTIGILSKVYRWSDIVYVGGGFGKEGIHNILEPAVYGSAVLFGPIHDKFIEAQSMLDANAAICVKNVSEFNHQTHQWMNDNSLCEEMGARAKSWIFLQPAATQTIIQFLKEKSFIS